MIEPARKHLARLVKPRASNEGNAAGSSVENLEVDWPRDSESSPMASALGARRKQMPGHPCSRAAGSVQVAEQVQLNQGASAANHNGVRVDLRVIDRDARGHQIGAH